AVVSVSGLDGAGKSAVVRALREAMTLCEIPTRVVWSRGGFTAGLEQVKRTARAALAGSLPGPTEREAKRRWLSRALPGGIFALTVILEQTFHHLVRVRLPRWLGVSIVCDRAAFDAAADLLGKLGPDRRMAQGAARLMLGAVPAPDLAILLRVPPETAARRKPDEADRDLLAAQAVTYDAMTPIHGLTVIDADRPEPEVVGEVVDMTLRCLFARFEGERGGGRP
ncbi:MAG TPA: hypothetical protein VFG76_08535, partial [Candidatus Polarisedimenticolia bacterium]|nr:hypothetical protein [Candidatus Polarisedimenticolia bacterium]